MVVGPPGSLKTTIIETAMENHPDSLILSDLNVQQWIKMKDEFVSKRYTSLAFAEFEKLYQRHPATASNLEGIIKALVSEGYGTGPGGDPRMPRIKARALVIGGITTDCFERRYSEWQKNGFIRRFIWLMISIQNPDAIVNAIREWKRIDFGAIAFRPANRVIQVTLSKERSRRLEYMMKSQPGLHGTGYVLLKKITAVLEWKYANTNGLADSKIEELLEELTPSLSKNGDHLILGKHL